MSVFHIMDKTMVDVLSTEANGGYYYNVNKYDTGYRPDSDPDPDPDSDEITISGRTSLSLNSFSNYKLQRESVDITDPSIKWYWEKQNTTITPERRSAPNENNGAPWYLVIKNAYKSSNGKITVYAEYKGIKYSKTVTLLQY